MPHHALAATTPLIPLPPLRAKTPEPDVPQAFSDALNRLFALQSQSGDAANLPACRRRMLDLMVRQSIPVRIQAMRHELSDADLYRLALLAAVSGLGEWKRDTPRNNTLLLDARGRLIPALVPSLIESDVLLCVICALLTMIAICHVLLTSSSSSSAS